MSVNSALRVNITAKTHSSFDLVSQLFRVKPIMLNVKTFIIAFKMYIDFLLILLLNVQYSVICSRI